ncbi:maleylacetate reductase [Cupriavidus pauculus]|uniref:maleylacetate reductase n=1 Tax=Cupriavidus pauculus TaxID=82633 RepID=UPI001EE1BFF9|nr:maleylacetate reductase [Cupriavidus pauculus]GJG96652.1 maleylacetate reductase [Cupriavidus pauculus]
MDTFSYRSRPQGVVFGAGSLKRLAEEADNLGMHRVLVLCTPGQRPLAELAADLLGTKCVGIFDKAVMHVPIESARQAVQSTISKDADGVVAIGGGSTIGLGKAIALESNLPVLAVPTTYAGSEMTPIYGLTEAGVKKTGRDARVLPRTVIYDPELSQELPLAVSVTSGINAIAHAAEGLYAHDRNPVSDWMAREGIAALGKALPVIARRSSSTNEAYFEARHDALYGAWLCGAVLGSVTVGLHHKLCHTLGGTFNLPHAEVHTIILPHALAYNARAASGAMADIATSLRAEGSFAPAAMFDFAVSLGAPTALRDFGLHERDLARACELALRDQYPNPRPLEAEGIKQLLSDAYAGRRPDRAD